MKNISKLFLSTVILGSLAAAPVTTFAADGGVYHSNGVIEFVPNDDQTNPVDPVDPVNPVDPVDPTDPDGKPDPGTKGPLSIDFASSLDFGQQKITSTDQVYKAAPQLYHLLGADGKPTGTDKKGPNYVQVTDDRGTETGWTLTLAQDAQFKSDKNHELKGAEITMKNANIQTASDSPKPTTTATITLVPGDDTNPGAAVTVMSAAAGQGAGTFLNDWGTDEASGADSIQLAVPGSTTKYAEKYSTKLTWTLTDVPGNSGTPAP